MDRRKLIIAIDGPAGSGKSSTAKALAKRLKLPYMDTGAMYRAVTLKAMEEKISFENIPLLIKLAKEAAVSFKGSDPASQKVFLDGKEVTKAIRRTELTKNVFHVAQEPLIRREMVKKQQALGQKAGGVMEGRDIGTMVFPDADFKFYFEANSEIRAKRRHRELLEAGKKTTLETVSEDIKRRDDTDTNRKEGPLRKAKDAHVIDTSSLTIGETIDKILQVIESKSFPHKADPSPMIQKGNVFFYKTIRAALFIAYRVFFDFKYFGANRVPSEADRRGVILAPNHASYLDPPILGISLNRPVTYLAKEYLFKHWFVGVVLRGIGAFPIRTRTDDFRTIRDLIRVLKNNRCVVVFPEGTRSPDGALRAAEGGVGFLAAKSAAAVVPVYIKGSFEAFPRGVNFFKCRPVEVYYGYPFVPAEDPALMGEEDPYGAIGRRIMKEIKALKEEADRKALS